PVAAHSPTERGLKDLRFLKGGLAFCDGVGLPQLAYHSAVVIDAKGRELAIAPKYENREIVLDVPARFMADAAYPVVVDPWLELDFSASVGGISKSGAVSDRPSLALAAGGNPWLAWADNRTGNYEIYVTYWNGFDFVDLGGGTLAGGISHTTKGIGAIGSVNPHITLDSAGLPYVCWQDDDEGRVGVYFRRWNGVALSWEQLDHSGETGGLSATFAGPALNPQVLAIESYVNNTKIPGFEQVPLIVWEEAGTIHALWHYSGDDQTIP